MTPAEHDRCYGRRLARNGLRLTRSDHAPYAWERIADYRARAAMISSDAFCTLTPITEESRNENHVPSR